jgi:hypothetical protein
MLGRTDSLAVWWKDVPTLKKEASEVESWWRKDVPHVKKKSSNLKDEKSPSGAHLFCLKEKKNNGIAQARGTVLPR